MMLHYNAILTSKDPYELAPKQLLVLAIDLKDAKEKVQKHVDKKETTFNTVLSVKKLNYTKDIIVISEGVIE